MPVNEQINGKNKINKKNYVLQQKQNKERKVTAIYYTIKCQLKNIRIHIQRRIINELK